MVKVLDLGWPCHEFEPSTTQDLQGRGVMHAKSVESSYVLPLFVVSKSILSGSESIILLSQSEAIFQEGESPAARIRLGYSTGTEVQSA
ncbi:hypothetical protein TNCV_4826711 [Trichonephila clavipes]|nr:hypothetical protein TNCV_4826711 [Trichonephila clavipes]